MIRAIPVCPRRPVRLGDDQKRESTHHDSDAPVHSPFPATASRLHLTQWVERCADCSSIQADIPSQSTEHSHMG